MNNLFFTLLTGLVIFQASISGVFAFAKMRIGCPQVYCLYPEICQYGYEMTYFANGCPGCYKCKSPPVCEDFACPMEYCEHGTESTVLENGCPGCPKCLPGDPQSACQECEAIVCENGYEETTLLENGCYTCPKCLSK